MTIVFVQKHDVKIDKKYCSSFIKSCGPHFAMLAAQAPVAITQACA